MSDLSPEAQALVAAQMPEAARLKQQFMEVGAEMLKPEVAASPARYRALQATHAKLGEQMSRANEAAESAPPPPAKPAEVERATNAVLSSLMPAASAEDARAVRADITAIGPLVFKAAQATGMHGADLAMAAAEDVRSQQAALDRGQSPDAIFEKGRAALAAGAKRYGMTADEAGKLARRYAERMGAYDRLRDTGAMSSPRLVLQLALAEKKGAR